MEAVGQAPKLTANWSWSRFCMSIWSSKASSRFLCLSKSPCMGIMRDRSEWLPKALAGFSSALTSHSSSLASSASSCLHCQWQNSDLGCVSLPQVLWHRLSLLQFIGKFNQDQIVHVAKWLCLTFVSSSSSGVWALLNLPPSRPWILHPLEASRSDDTSAGGTWCDRLSALPPSWPSWCL